MVPCFKRPSVQATVFVGAAGLAVVLGVLTRPSPPPADTFEYELWKFPGYRTEMGYYVDAVLKPDKPYIYGGALLFAAVVTHTCLLLPLFASAILLRRRLLFGLSKLTVASRWLLLLVGAPGLCLLGWIDQGVEAAGPIALALYPTAGAAMGFGQAYRRGWRPKSRILTASVSGTAAVAVLLVVAGLSLHFLYHHELCRRIVLPPSKHKMGYIDKVGRIVIEPRFDRAWPFHEGMARVMIRGRYGFIDKTEKLVAECRYREADDFSDGLAAIRLSDLFGFIDTSGRVVIAPQWPYVGSFRNGRAMVNVGGENPYPKYRPAFPQGGEWFLIDKQGTILYDVPYSLVPRFCCGLAPVMIGDKWGYIDTDWETVIEPRFTYAAEFSEGLAIVAVGDMCGVMDTKGDFAVEPRFKWGDLDFTGFHEGLAAARVKGKWGYIDRTGKFRIEPRFDNPPSWFSAGLASVVVNNRTVTIDKEGRVVPESRFVRHDFFHEGLAPAPTVESPRRWGYVDPKGDFVIPPQFLRAERFSEGLAGVRVLHRD